MKLKFAILGLVFFGGLLITGYSMRYKSEILKIWTPRTPYSADPLDYDALAHHICFRSIYSSLVSDYKLGEIKGIISSHWTTKEDKTEWTFFIRNDLFFSNNDQITSKEVALSLTRVAYRMKTANSNSGVLEHLIGYANLKKANQQINGITYDQKSVTLRFTKPMPDLLEKISFGLYAIVSSKNFNVETGEWHNKKTIISSGPYEILEWSDSQLKLKLRLSFPNDLLLSNPIQEVVFQFDHRQINHSDLVIDFDDSLAVDNNFSFFGPVKSAIRYVECEGWKNPDSICYQKNVRLKLRNIFYQKLKQNNFEVTKSFFPLTIKNIYEFTDVSISDLNELSIKTVKNITSNKVNPAFKSAENITKITPQEAYDLGIDQIGEVFKLPVVHLETDPKSPLAKNVDFRFRMTAILVDSPIHDIVFMFKSQHGIKLPDQTGEINKLISQESFSPQDVNKLLWDQAIIWPLGHMSLGIWKQGNRVNLNSYNLILPPLDLQWIEWK